VFFWPTRGMQFAVPAVVFTPSSKQACWESKGTHPSRASMFDDNVHYSVCPAGRAVEIKKRSKDI